MEVYIIFTGVRHKNVAKKQGVCHTLSEAILMAQEHYSFSKNQFKAVEKKIFYTDNDFVIIKKHIIQSILDRRNYILLVKENTIKELSMKFTQIEKIHLHITIGTWFFYEEIPYICIEIIDEHTFSTYSLLGEDIEVVTIDDTKELKIFKVEEIKYSI